MRGEQVQEEAAEGFDFKVTKRHPKTGLVIETNAYTLRMVGEGTQKRKYLERPVGSGNLWNAKGEPVGRWDKTKPEGKRFLEGAKHVEWNPPMSADQKLARDVAAKDLRIKALEQELQAIQKEKDRKSAPQAKETQTKGA